MTPKQKLKRIFELLPKKARGELVYNFIEEDFVESPISLNVCWVEIENNTKLGEKNTSSTWFQGE